MKRIISMCLFASILVVIFAASAVSAGAETYISFGEWKLLINEDTTYYVAGYSGTETAPVFPETAYNRDIVGIADDFIKKCSCGITSVSLPEKYTKIGTKAFFNCETLTTVNFPGGLTDIGAMAFSGCTSLESVDLSEETNITKIPYNCFSGCASLEEAVLPDSLTAVSDYAFSQTALQSVTLPADVTSIGDYSFSECAALTEVVFPVGFKKIGERAFNNSTSLTSVYLPASIDSIGLYAFFPEAYEGGRLTVDCYAGTYAASYAYDNFVKCSGETLVKGDVDNNGVTDINDATYIQLYRVGNYSIDNVDSAKTLDRIDVTGDNKITIRDTTQIQLYLAGYVSEL